MIQAALIALIAFLAYMGDALGYSQYDRPLCTGVLVGIALNDVQQGLMVGASLELVYMGTLTIGGAFPPDIYTGGILGTAFAITTGSGIEGGSCTFPSDCNLRLADKTGYLYVCKRILCTPCRPLCITGE